MQILTTEIQDQITDVLMDLIPDHVLHLVTYRGSNGRTMNPTDDWLEVRFNGTTEINGIVHGKFLPVSNLPEVLTARPYEICTNLPSKRTK